jgi:tetraacyldisaccharide 4'-kinase
VDENTEVLLVTGIANPRPLKNWLEERIQEYDMMHFSDHHIFSIDDWKEIKKRFGNIDSENKILLTTEKDATRLLKFRQEMDGMPFYVVPIEHRFLFHEETAFNDEVITFIGNFKKPS